MARYDLTVRGGGIFGLSIAWEAAQRGARVRLIETAQIGAGSSGGIVGALAPHVPENWNEKKQFQLESLLATEAFLATATEATGLPTGYARTGRLQPLSDEKAVTLAHQRHLNAQTLWGGHAQWQVIQTTDAWSPETPTGLLVHDTLTARLNPRQTLNALAAALRTKGDIVLGDAPDDGPDDSPTLHATGLAGLHALSQALNRTIGTGVKGQAILLAHDARSQPQLFVDTLHIIPHADGTTAIGSTSEHHWTHDDPDAQLDALLQKARTAIPALQNAAVIERWSGIRPRAITRAPLLGPWPNRPGHFIANGGFKIGFGMAAKVAQVMVDLVLEGKDAIPQPFHTATL